MKAFLLGSALCIGTFAGALAKDHTLHTFKKTELSDQFWGEGAHFGDFNRDGKRDVVSGPYWWEGPEFKVRQEFYPATETFKKQKAGGGDKEPWTSTSRARITQECPEKCAMLAVCVFRVPSRNRGFG